MYIGLIVQNKTKQYNKKANICVCCHMHSHRSEIDKLSYSRPFEAWGGDGASGGGWTLISVQFSLVQSLSFVLLCDSMDRSMPGPLSVTDSRSLPGLYTFPGRIQRKVGEECARRRRSRRASWLEVMAVTTFGWNSLPLCFTAHCLWVASLPLPTSLMISLRRKEENVVKFTSPFTSWKSPVCWLGRTPNGPRWGGYSRKTPYVTPWFWHGTNGLYVTEHRGV